MKIASKLKVTFKRKYVAVLITPCLLMAYSSSLLAFTCRVNNQSVGAGTAQIYVDLTPVIQDMQNVIVDLSSKILCKNDTSPIADIDIDFVRLLSGSKYSGPLENLKGTVIWNNISYTMPLTNNTANIVIDHREFLPLPLQLNLTPEGVAGGKVIKKNDLIASIKMFKIGSHNGGFPKEFMWDVYANNDVVIPTGGCDVSSRNVTVTLPDYPGTEAIPLTVHCAKDQQLAYYLTGLTTGAGNSVFANTSSLNPAQGVGVQLSNNTDTLATNTNIPLGTVGLNPVSLGLTATYVRTSEKVVAGNVQAIVGVTFVYQ